MNFHRYMSIIFRVLTAFFFALFILWMSLISVLGVCMSLGDSAYILEVFVFSAIIAGFSMYWALFQLL